MGSASQGSVETTRRSKLGTKEIECVGDVAAGATVVRDVPAELRARFCLVPEEVEALAELGRRVERHYGRAQDIEWAIARTTGEIFLLQSRPETVWAARRRLPVTSDPLSRIAAAYLPKR